MNDFTKDELDYIESSIYFNEIEHHQEKDFPKYAVEIINKIRYMIDNYCEHKDSYEDFSYNPTRCKECDAITSR